MKAEKFYGKTAIGMTFVLLLLLVSSLSAVPVGMFCYRNSPDSIAGDTVPVNDTMVAMAGKIRVMPCTTRNNTIFHSPSIFFIIDNSYSMGGPGGSDSAGNRFSLASKIIDTMMSMYPMYPMAEVGLAVFSGGLYYNPASKPGVFQTVTTPAMGLDDTGAFLPLLTLKATYGTQTGYEILKEVLAVNNGTLTYPSILASQQGCNICCGFDAVLQAFPAAISVKRHQFIIFLSDGLANLPIGGSEDFTGATNCPATFSIYFSDQKSVPSTIRTYTENCRANFYSTTNALSQALVYNNSISDSLIKFIINNCIDVINSDPGRFYSITVNGITSNYWSAADSMFYFPSIFPLQHFITPFNCDIQNCDYTNKKVNFWVKTRQGTVLPRTTYNVHKWDRNLVFRDSAGTAIVAATEAIDSIGLYFNFARIDTLYTYSKVSIELRNNLAPVDKETVVLDRGTNCFSGKFKRVVSAQPTPGNSILETREENDSIIAIFRNSETPILPLDTLRIAIPYQKESAIRLSDRIKHLSPSRELVIGPYRLDLNMPVEGPFTLHICDIKGAMVKLVTVKNPNLALPSTLLPKKSGFYIITVATKQKRESKRVLITR
jgi:hypothetical protein